MADQITLGACGCCGPGTVCACEDFDIFCELWDDNPLGLNAPLLRWNSIVRVDVIGPGFHDLLPGNGRYVDLAGTGGVGEINGVIQTKDLVTIDAAPHILHVRLAGNQRQDLANFRARVQYGTIDETIIIDDWKQPFTIYEFPIMGPHSGVITIEHLPGPVGRVGFYGILLDCVRVYPEASAPP